MTKRLILPLLFASLSTLGSCTEQSTQGPEQESPEHQNQEADLLFVNGYVYTVDKQRSIAEAIAVRAGEITYVGTTATAMELAGDSTRVIDLDGRMLIPGLHDVHIHLIGIVERDVCDLESVPVTLAQMVESLSDCLRRYEISPGEWLNVEQWNPFAGNDPSLQYPTIRAALDAVSTEHPIMLQGNDGHHGAVNSVALAGAVDGDGVQVGLSGETLRTQFADYTEFVGLDTRGEPNGALNEDARTLVAAPGFFAAGTIGEVAPKIGPVLASHGITSVQDPALPPEALATFAELEAIDALKFRFHAAMLLDPAEYTSEGQVDIEHMIADLTLHRERYADSRLVSANAAKIFVDGVIEGNPYVSPPTLPNGAALEPYLQPIFEVGETTADLKLVGYVDTDSTTCQSVRSGSAELNDDTAVQAFFAANGYHPAQCSVSRGVLEDDEAFIKAYTQALDAAGFTVHAHVLGDRAARVAIEAFEQAIAHNGPSDLPHTLAHLQMVRPEDVVRIGKLGLNVAFTYAWIEAGFSYDMMVAPFITRLDDETHLYDADNDYIRYVYPVRSVMEAGGKLVAGSDAPVSDRSPRPFANILQAVTRATGGTVINADERIDIHDVLAAYTINGAASLKQSDLVGSIEVGKRADLTVLDRNLVELYEREQWEAIRDTRVLMTIFDGEVVHALAPLGK